MLDTLCIPLMTHTETYSFSASLSVLLLSIACYSPERIASPVGFPVRSVLDLPTGCSQAASGLEGKTYL